MNDLAPKNAIVVRSIAAGSVIGSLAAVSIAAIPTTIDWHINPAGLFHSGADNNWPIIFETWLSWFYPLLFFTIPVASLACAWVMLRNTTKAKR